MKCSRSGLVYGKKDETLKQKRVRRNINIVNQHLLIAKAGTNEESQQMAVELEAKLDRLEKEYKSI